MEQRVNEKRMKAMKKEKESSVLFFLVQGDRRERT